MHYVPTALVSAVLLLLPTFASAQSLGEVAAREREKRKNAKPTKIYTERDLRGAGQGAPVNIGTGEVTTGAPTTEGETAQAGQQPGASEPGAKKEKTEEEVRAEAQKNWKDQVDKANAEIQRLSDQVARMEADAGDLTGPLYGASRQTLLNRIEEAKKQLATAQQNLETLVEQGRRQGFR